MNTPPCPTTRREFLRSSAGGVGLLAFSRFAPAFLVQSTLAGAPKPEKDRSVLVLVQLAGGNDGLNTVVPYTDDRYYRLRPSLALKRDAVLPLSDNAGLHPACTALRDLFNEGRLGIVQNVGYPNPNRSHFRSTEIWETASGSDEILGTGWVGRYLDACCSGAPLDTNGPDAVHAGLEVPQAFSADNAHTLFGLEGRRRRGKTDTRLLQQLSEAPFAREGSNHEFLRHTLMDTLVTERRVERILAEDRPEARYPNSSLGQSLRQVAALVAAGFSTRVYYVSLGGFDTHSGQLNRHQRLLQTLDDALVAFQRDLTARRLDQQVMTMTFSEFGRRPAENESGGTDHGTAAPLFILGGSLRGGWYGAAPSLAVEQKQDLTFSTDFRQVYATVLDRWLGAPSASILGGDFAALDFV